MLEINPSLQSQVFDSLVLHMKAGRNRPDRSLAAEMAWKSLATDLRRMGLEQTVTDALVTWANNQSDQSRRAELRIRMLHPMEREFISMEAYDHMLELLRLGLINQMQMEQLIENCAFLTNLPAGKAQIQKMVLRFFVESLDAQGLGRSH